MAVGEPAIYLDGEANVVKAYNGIEECKASAVHNGLSRPPALAIRATNLIRDLA